MVIAFYVLVALANIVMITGLVLALKLRRIAPGGSIGKVVRFLLILIVVFTVGYLASPAMTFLPQEVNLIFVALIFLLGALYVVLVLWLVQHLIRKVMAELEL